MNHNRMTIKLLMAMGEKILKKTHCSKRAYNILLGDLLGSKSNNLTKNTTHFFHLLDILINLWSFSKISLRLH